VLEIAGEMDLQAGPLLSDVGDDPCFVVFDLQGVTFMDCSSLRVLQNTQHRALDAGGAVRLAAPSEHVLRILRLTRLEGAFPVFDSVRDATSRGVNPQCDPTRRRSRCPGSR
jgi:anti-anti-sigma factor